MPQKVKFELTISMLQHEKQDCIPAGCVPPVHLPYLPACSMLGVVSAPGGVCSWGVCSQGAVCSWGGVCSRGCTWSQGCTWSGSPPVDRHTPVNICHGMLWNPPIPPADLIALSPGYRVPPDLATVPYAPWHTRFALLEATTIGSNVRNDVVGSVT